MDALTTGHESVEGGVTAQIDAAAATPAATIGTAAGFALFAAKGDAPIAAVSRGDVKAGGIKKGIFGR